MYYIHLHLPFRFQCSFIYIFIPCLHHQQTYSELVPVEVSSLKHFFSVPFSLVTSLVSVMQHFLRPKRHQKRTGEEAGQGSKLDAPRDQAVDLSK